MWLVAVEVDGFRRFGSIAKLEVDGALTALVGANEAGKTSLLEAMRRLDDHEPIAPADRTRQLDVADATIVVQALYLIEGDDRLSLSGLSEAVDPLRSRFYLQQKAAHGGQSHSLIPGLLRDRGPRRQALNEVRRLHRNVLAGILADADSFETEIEESEEPQEPPVLTTEKFSLLITMLESDEEWLNDVPLLQSFTSAIEHLGDERLNEAAVALRAASAYESAKHPNDQAVEMLRSRLPGFLKFTDADREFETDNDLAEVAHDPPRALANLASLAGLDLPRVLQLMEDDDSGTLVGVLGAANTTLATALESWSQEEITVRFDRQGGTVLRIHVSDAAGGYTKIDERSDGLKVFGKHPRAGGWRAMESAAGATRFTRAVVSATRRR